MADLPTFSPKPILGAVAPQVSVNVNIRPRAQSSQNYTTGAVTGNVLELFDYGSFTWYLKAAGLERIRSSMSETPGNVLTLANVSVIDGRYSETYLASKTIDTNAQRAFLELFKTDPTLMYYPAASEGQGFENDFDGSTKNRRLELRDMPRIFGRAEDYTQLEPHLVTRPLSSQSVKMVALQHALQFVCDVVSDTYPELSFAPVPKLYYGDAADETAYVAAFLVSQVGDNKITVRQFFESILSFTPVILRTNAQGLLEFKPLRGPDAFAKGVRVLKGDETLPIMPSRADPSNLYNAATYSEEVQAYVDGVQISSDTAFQISAGAGGAGAYDPVPSSYFLIGGKTHDWRNDDTEAGVYVYPFSPDKLVAGDYVYFDTQVRSERVSQGDSLNYRDFGTAFDSQYQTLSVASDAAKDAPTVTVEPLTKAIAQGQYITFENAFSQSVQESYEVGDTVLTLTFGVDVALKAGTKAITSNMSLGLNFSADSWQTLVTVIDERITNIARIPGAGHITLQGQYDRIQNALVFRVRNSQLDGTSGDTYYIWTFTFLMAAFGTAFEKTGERISARFGYDLSADSLDPGDGSNLLATSRDKYGLIEKEIRSNYLSLGLEGGLALVKAFVKNNIFPRRKVKVKQAYPFVVDFDDIGERFTLPNGDTGIVEPRNYADERTFTSASAESGFTLSVTEEEP